MTPGIGIAPGNVVKSFGTNDNDFDDKKTKDVTELNKAVWKQLMIRANDPTDEVQIQTFTIYTKPSDGGTDSDGLTGIGLSRTVTLVLRNPWDYIRMETFPGQWNDDSEWPDYDPDESPEDPNVNYYVGAQKGAPLTIFWELPAGLPEAMFPLDFQIESDRQNIENAGVGNAVVQSGPSLFKDDKGITDSRISYIKTVRWEDYAPDGESTPQSRIIRARFVTTTNIENLNGDEYLSTVRIHNPYFNDLDDQFLRNQRIVVDTYENSFSYDFTDSVFNPVSSDFSDRAPNGGKSVTYTYDGHDITLYNARASSNANAQTQNITAIAGQYILFRYGTNTFTFSLGSTRPAEESGYTISFDEAIIEIEASDNSDDGSATDGIIKVSTTSGSVSPSTYSVNTKGIKTFSVKGMTAAKPTITIQPNDNNSKIRFYNIKVTEKYSKTWNQN